MNRYSWYSLPLNQTFGWIKARPEGKVQSTKPSHSLWNSKSFYENHKLRRKGSENSYQELKRSQKGQAHTNTRKLNRDISTGTAVFLNRKRVNVCEHTIKTCVCVCLSLLWSLQFLVRVFTFLCDFRTSVLSFPRGQYRFSLAILISKH